MTRAEHAPKAAPSRGLHELRTSRSECAARPTPRGWRIEQADAVEESPLLICYDGSEGARNAITAAAALLVSREAVILHEPVEGSLSHEIAEHGRRPVLVVPPSEGPLS
jgi:hypothetical protein